MTNTTRIYGDFDAIDARTQNFIDIPSLRPWQVCSAPTPTYIAPNGEVSFMQPTPEEESREDTRLSQARLKVLFEQYGITCIPESEVTDMGAYVLWNNYHPSKIVLLDDPQRIGREIAPQENDWEMSQYAIQLERYVGALSIAVYAYPDKPVRVRQLYSVGSGGLLSLHTRIDSESQVPTQQVLTTRTSIVSVTTPSEWFPASLLRPRSVSAGLDLPYRCTRCEMRDTPRGWRAMYMSDLLNSICTRGLVGYGYSHHADTIQEVFTRSGGESSAAVALRGNYVMRSMYKPVRTRLKDIGAMIAETRNDQEAQYAEDILDLLGDLPAAVLSRATSVRITEAWNAACRLGEEITHAECGHFERADGTHDTSDGLVCDDCFDEDYVFCEDDEEYHLRGDVYEHSDGCYRTYEEEEEEEEDEWDDDNIPGVRGYGANVLDYVSWASQFKVTPYGDLLMGIELEVVPDGDVPEAARHTAHTLCRDFAILKHDGSLDSGGFEICTAPRLLTEHIAQFKAWEPYDTLRAWDAGCCGLHVHLSSKAFTQASLGKFIEFINSDANAPLIKSIAGRHPSTDSQAENYCQQDRLVIGNPKKTLEGKSRNRYRMVNTTNLDYREVKRLGLLRTHDDPEGHINTVELRIFRASLKKARLLAQIEFAHAAVMFCRWSSMRELDALHFKMWLRDAAGLYPNLAKWFGVRANTKEAVAIPQECVADEV